MNGSKAKILRNLAGVKAANETSMYMTQKGCERTKEIKSHMGEVLGTYTTNTIMLKPGVRKIYQHIKKQYMKAINQGVSLSQVA